MTDFEEIYQKYFKDVYLFVLSLSKDEHIAEDVTQETFYKALKGLSDFKGHCDIRVWLCQIAKNEYFTIMRKRKKVTHIEGEDEEQWEQQVFKNVANQNEKGPEQKLMDKEMELRVHSILHNMQEPYKEVFNLRVFGELSFKHIAEIFGKNENWACVTYHRAKMMIKKEMTK